MYVRDYFFTMHCTAASQLERSHESIITFWSVHSLPVPYLYKLNVFQLAVRCHTGKTNILTVSSRFDNRGILLHTAMVFFIGSGESSRHMGVSQAQSFYCWISISCWT